MQRTLALSAVVLATAAGVAATPSAADTGAAAGGRPIERDGVQALVPILAGGHRHGGYLIGGPVLAPRPDMRQGYYGRLPPGYAGIYYGTVPGAAFEIPYHDRMYCPESRAYFPAVQECATPWLRLRPGGGVTADSPIPMPNGLPYGR